MKNKNKNKNEKREAARQKEEFEKLHPLAPWEIKQLGEGVARAIQMGQRQIKDEWRGFQQGWQAALAAPPLGTAPKCPKCGQSNLKIIENAAHGLFVFCPTSGCYTFPVDISAARPQTAGQSAHQLAETIVQEVFPSMDTACALRYVEQAEKRISAWAASRTAEGGAQRYTFFCGNTTCEGKHKGITETCAAAPSSESEKGQ